MKKYTSILKAHKSCNRGLVLSLFNELSEMEKVEFLIKLKNGELTCNIDVMLDLTINLLIDKI